jgi:hypothetical protein
MRCVWHPNVRRDKSISIDVFAIPASPVLACSQQSYTVQPHNDIIVFSVSVDNVSLLFRGAHFFFYFFFFFMSFRTAAKSIQIIYITLLYCYMLLVSGAADSAPAAAHRTACDFFYVYTIRPMSAQRLHSIIIYTRTRHVRKVFALFHLERFPNNLHHIWRQRCLRT